MSLIEPETRQTRTLQTRQTSKITSFQLVGAPDVPALTDYLHMVMEHQPGVLELRWPLEDKFYSLVLLASGRSGEVRWSLHFASSLLWDYVSCDVLLIHNMIEMACNKQGHLVHGDDLLVTPSVSRNLQHSLDIYFAEKSSRVAPVRTIPPKPIDATAIESVMLKLRDPDTGLYTYPAFLYFLEQAYFLSCRTRAPISVVLIELGNNLEKSALLTKKQMFELVTHLSATKRRTDLIAQYEPSSIILLAPSTDHYGVKTFSKRLDQTLTTVLSSGVKKKVPFSMGLATFPKDGESMGMLLAAAEAAKNHAKSSKLHVASFEDIK